MKEPVKGLDESYLVTPKQRRQATSKRANAKISEIRERLRALAVEKGAGNQLPTIRELCTLLNTSSATLTAALDLLETEQILARKERQGIFVTESIHQGIIHVVFNVYSLTDTGRSPFWSVLWANLVHETEHRSSFKHEQYRFHFPCIPSGQPLPADYVELINVPQTRGCIIVGLNARTHDHQQLLHIPNVVVAGGGSVMIQTDAAEKSRLATQALIQHGCKKIALWLPQWMVSEGDISYEEYQDVPMFKQVMAQHQLPLYPGFIRTASMPPFAEKRLPTLQEQGYFLAKEIFGSFNENKPDAIYIADDMLASGALVAFEELGIRVGKDIVIASLANAGSPILFGREKQMITVEYDSADIVRAMFSELDTAIAHGYTPEDRIVKIRPHLRLPT